MRMGMHMCKSAHQYIDNVDMQPSIIILHIINPRCRSLARLEHVSEEASNTSAALEQRPTKVRCAIHEPLPIWLRLHCRQRRLEVRSLRVVAWCGSVHDDARKARGTAVVLAGAKIGRSTLGTVER